MNERDSSFLSRWSRRKAQGREGVASPDKAGPAPPQPAVTDAAASALPARPATQPPPAQTDTEPAVAPAAPTLADVAALSAQSDYSRFVAEGVTAEVKNAALKKLFTAPHFNIMDGLDTYIDDYGKPDPLPAGMLRKMAQSQLLGLFADEDRAKAAGGPRPETAAAPATTAATASPCPNPALDGQGAPRAAAGGADELPGHADDAAPH